MKTKELLIAGAMALAFLAPAGAAEDLSSFGTPVGPVAHQTRTANSHWPTHICAEIQRVEHIAISGPLHPSDRGIARFGLLMLEQRHCGIDISRKIAADQSLMLATPSPSSSMNCITHYYGSDGASTNCN